MDDPIVIVGVSRSGTTLLRLLLGSHRDVAAAPETPWITGAYGDGSLRELVEKLASSSVGPRNLSGIGEDDLFAAARAFALTILARYAERRGKRFVVVKTPKDLERLDVLAKVFPEARYVHILRDGRDVAASTLRRKPFLGSRLGSHGEINAVNAVRRWRDAEDEIARRGSDGRMRIAAHVRYERLVSEPRGVLEEVTAALGLPFDEEMLRYDLARHDLPTWEAGSTDVRERAAIDAASVGRWRTDLSNDDKRAIDRELGDDLVRLGYGRCSP